jgi:hypothetical protein
MGASAPEFYAVVDRSPRPLPISNGARPIPRGLAARMDAAAAAIRGLAWRALIIRRRAAMQALELR